MAKKSSRSGYKLLSPQWVEKNTAWRKAIATRVKRWAKVQGQSYDPVTERIVRARIGRLDQFVRWFFDDAGPAPFSVYDAAGLIVLPRHQALRLSRKLFGGGPGIAKDLQAEDIPFNMDWFTPQGFK